MNFFLIFSQESRSWGLRNNFLQLQKYLERSAQKMLPAPTPSHAVKPFSTEIQHRAKLDNTRKIFLCEPVVYNLTDGMIWFSQQRLWNWMIPWGDKIKLAFWENRAWSFPLGCDRCDYAQPTIRHRHENSLRNRACPILNQGPLYLPNSVVAKTKEPRLKGSINVLH